MLRLTHLFHSLWIVLAFSCALHAEEIVVWQIGTFDGNHDDLAIARNHGAYMTTFPNDVTFTVGKDDVANAWSYIQPGPGDAWAGSKAHPFTIIFNLPQEPTGTYRLTVAMVDTHSTMPPVYEVQVNEKHGSMPLPQGGGDGSIVDPSKGKPYTLNIDIPFTSMHRGENKIILQSIAGSWLSYDAVRLANDPDASAVEPVINSLTLTPTVCFVMRESRLKQVVILNAQFNAPVQDCIATLNFAGASKPLPVSSELFGNALTTIEVDEVTETTPMEVVLTSGGQTIAAMCEVRPEKHWKVYVQDSSHIDIGYTDLQERVKVTQNNNITTALELCRKYPDFKWNTETAWVEDNYLSMMPADLRDEFISRAKDGQIGCQANYCNILTGICSNESLIRYLYYAHAMSAKYGIPFDIATSSDVPTQVWTLPTVLAGSGIRYFSAGLNLVRADSFNRLFNKSPFYWEGPDGSKVLTWLASGYGEAMRLGLNSEMTQTLPMVNSFIETFKRQDYQYDAALAYGGYYDNMPLFPRLAEIADVWNKTYEYPKLIFCRGPEFFQYIESNFQDKIPTIIGDGGVYWEDGAGSSAYETAISRCAKEDLVSAEKMLSLSSIFNGKAYPADSMNEAWKNAILYDEHTWGAAESRIHPETDNSKEQWAYKSKFATEAAKAASSFMSDGIDGIAGLVNVDEPSILVFNPNSWNVNGIAYLQQPGGERTGFEVDVPAMGIELYPLSVLSKPVTQSALPANILENQFYRLELDANTGAVMHLYDKELNRELVDASASYGLNQYLYFSGGGETMKDVTYTSGNPHATMSREVRPGCDVVTIQTSAFNTPSLVTQIILYNKVKRIDFLNTLDKTPTTEYEAGYFAFPFSINNPQFHVSIPNGVVSPNTDMLAGGCMAWYCPQDFVAVSDDTVALVWTAVDSPLVTLSDINREVVSGFDYPELKPYTAGKRWPVPLDKGHVYGYVFNNYWFTNYKASQGGNLQFRFSLTSMKSYDSAKATRFGQSVRNPLIAKVVQPQALESSLTISAPLCSVSPENVSIQTIKRAESGEGWIIRLREVGGKPAQATITLPAINFDRAWICNLVEDSQSKLEISNNTIEVPVKANGLSTVRVQ